MRNVRTKNVEGSFAPIWWWYIVYLKWGINVINTNNYFLFTWYHYIVMSTHIVMLGCCVILPSSVSLVWYRNRFSFCYFNLCFVSHFESNLKNYYRYVFGFLSGLILVAMWLVQTGSSNWNVATSWSVWLSFGSISIFELRPYYYGL